jgi:phosphate transport system substrate-binding protein
MANKSKQGGVMRPFVRGLLQAGLLMLILVATGGCGTPDQEEEPTPTQASSSVRVTFAGSTTVQPLAEKLGEVYRQKNPNVVLDISAGGSRVGIQAIQEGSTDIGMASRELHDDEQTDGMEQFQIAIDVLAIIVHTTNPVEQLSLEQLRGIYTGEITNWSEVGGSDMPIAPIIREVSSGTRGAFDEIVLEDGVLLETPENTEITAGEVHTRVATSPDAIGYVGFGHVGGEDVKVLAIDGVEPSPETATDGSYQLKRPLLLLLGPLSRPQARSFVEFALSDEGQQIVADDGWVPVRRPSEPTSPPTTRPAYPAPTTRPAYPAPTTRPAYPAPTTRPAYPAPTTRPAYPAPTTRPAYPAPPAQPDYPEPPSE